MAGYNIKSVVNNENPVFAVVEVVIANKDEVLLPLLGRKVEVVYDFVLVLVLVVVALKLRLSKAGPDNPKPKSFEALA